MSRLFPPVSALMLPTVVVYFTSWVVGSSSLSELTRLLELQRKCFL